MDINNFESMLVYSYHLKTLYIKVQKQELPIQKIVKLYKAWEFFFFFNSANVISLYTYLISSHPTYLSIKNLAKIKISKCYFLSMEFCKLCFYILVSIRFLKFILQCLYEYSDISCHCKASTAFSIWGLVQICMWETRMVVQSPSSHVLWSQYICLHFIHFFI